ncbi:MAG: hypothetical protein NZM26_04000 [Patescibacteria group bacterium]|nr:hypothetical protein [Patescibacteria group bacterium]
MDTYIRFNYSNNFSFLFRKFAGSIVLATVILVLFVVIFSIGNKIISAEWENYKKNQQTKEILVKRKETLSNISQNAFDKSQAIAIALPDKNPILWTISQIKIYLTENPNTLIKSFVVGGEDKSLSDINALTFTVEIESKDISSIIDLIDYMQSVSPIVKVQSLNTDSNDLVAKSKIVMSVYWSAYPAKLDNINQSIFSLNQEEIEVLNSVAELKQPVFSSLSPSVPSIRENPFN